jgi:hypothetical protein
LLDVRGLCNAFLHVLVESLLSVLAGALHSLDSLLSSLHLNFRLIILFYVLAIALRLIFFLRLAIVEDIFEVVVARLIGQVLFCNNLHGLLNILKTHPFVVVEWLCLSGAFALSPVVFIPFLFVQFMGLDTSLVIVVLF